VFGKIRRRINQSSFRELGFSLIWDGNPRYLAYLKGLTNLSFGGLEDKFLPILKLRFSFKLGQNSPNSLRELTF